jgi:hypothetical protein
MKHPIKLRTIRRSVALTGPLVEEVSTLAPPSCVAIGTGL